MTDRGPAGDGRGPDPVLRAVLVVALLAVAGLALQARQGLDWGELADPVHVRWARVIAASVVLLLLSALVRRLLRRLRRPRLPERATDQRAEPEGEPFPLLPRVLLVLVVLAALAAAWFLADAIAPEVPADQGPPPEADPDGGDGAGRNAPWPTLAAVAAVLLTVALASRLAGVRRERDRDGEAEPSPDEPDAAELSAAVEAAGAQLAGHDDARAAIVAAYAAMAASITAGLARRADSARASDTPTELLDRAVSSGLVDGGPAATLTALFREARFSRHPMGEPQRRSAEDALDLVRDELAARRA